MNYEDLILEKKNGIATITLNVPEKLNALTQKMRLNLPLAVDEIAADDEIRVVILTGAGKGFCSGADVGGQQAKLDGTFVESRHQKIQTVGWPYADIFPKLDKPVIAAINGACAGAGFAVALSCDIRIASENAKFGALQIARGLVADAGLTYYLPRLVGNSKALELMLTGKLIMSAEAEKMGIVNKVIPLEQLMPAAIELANEIKQQPPIAAGLIKRIVWRSMLDDLNRQLDLETYAQQICRNTEDHKESVRAFLNKLPKPEYKGK